VSSNYRIVVIGGYGNFGARICRRLGIEPSLQIVATARAALDPAPEGAIAARLNSEASSFSADLAALAPDLVIHCAGPYQGQSYRVAEAALACDAHYLDLSDGRDFVARFAVALNERAMAVQRSAISGASTLPGLSSAVVGRYLAQFDSLESIEIAIAPGQHAPRGAATMAAVLGYAGQPLRWMSHGHWKIVHGWQEMVRMHFPFGNRWAAACDVPDLELFPDYYRGVKTVTFRAALEVSAQHFALWTLAGLRRAGLPLPLTRWAAHLNRVGTWLDRFGSDCGGMRVDLGGTVSGGARQRIRWQLTAPGNHGPEIPCMAAVLLALKLARGEAVPLGARPCMGLLSLEDFAPEFARWGITSGIEVSAA
jgi:hypothetical protein